MKTENLNLNNILIEGKSPSDTNIVTEQESGKKDEFSKLLDLLSFPSESIEEKVIKNDSLKPELMASKEKIDLDQPQLLEAQNKTIDVDIDKDTDINKSIDKDKELISLLSKQDSKSIKNLSEANLDKLEIKDFIKDGDTKPIDSKLERKAAKINEFLTLKEKNEVLNNFNDQKVKMATKNIQGTTPSQEFLSLNKSVNKNLINQYKKEANSINENIIQNNTFQDSSSDSSKLMQNFEQFKTHKTSNENLITMNKTVDLTNINASSPSELMEKISNLIEKNNISTDDSMEVFVKHKDLGQFKIEVNRNEFSNNLDIKILSQDKVGHEFFVENESQLNKALSQSGIKVSNLKMAMQNDSLMSSDSNKDFSQNFSQGKDQGSSSQKGFSQENSDSQRRKHLWQAYQENVEQNAA